MSTTDDSTPLVQLGQLEVSLAALDAEGDFLDTFTNNLLLHPAFVAERSLTVPLMGWRVVFECGASDGIEAQQVIAAPHPTRVDAWVTASRIASQDGFATYRFSPEPATPVLPREQRRAQLALKWPDDHTNSTSLADLRIHLVNTSTEPWEPTEIDDFFVAGSVESTADGIEVTGGGFFAYIDGSPEAVALAPGAHRELVVEIEEDFLARLPPGEYVVMAVLISLELTSATAIATRY
jgi:hypothetical protein